MSKKCRQHRGNKCSCPERAKYELLQNEDDSQGRNEEEEIYSVVDLDTTPSAELDDEEEIRPADLEEQEEIWSEVTLPFHNTNPTAQKFKVIFFNDLTVNDWKAVTIGGQTSAGHLCQIFESKNKSDVRYHSIIEYWEDLGVARRVEDHEYVLAIYFDQANYASQAGQYVFQFVTDMKKYKLFTDLEHAFVQDMLNVGSTLLTLSTMSTHSPLATIGLQLQSYKSLNTTPAQLKEMVEQDRCPDLVAQVYLRHDPKQSWTRCYMFLNNQKLFISQNAKSLLKFAKSLKEPAKSRKPEKLWSKRLLESGNYAPRYY